MDAKKWRGVGMKFVLLCGVLVFLWLFVSRILTMFFVDGTDPKNEDQVLETWRNIFLLPILLLILLASWLQMKSKQEMAGTVEIMTMGMVSPEVSEDINDYLP